MSEVSLSKQEGSEYVLIPCPQDKFAEFLGGLLGKPQVIERSVTGSFTLNRDDLVNFHHLIEQRVHGQNKASLIQFAATIFYDDYSSVEVRSLKDFTEYAEIRPLVANKVALSWIYLVQFLSNSVPERQQIDVTIGINNRDANKKTGDIDEVIINTTQGIKRFVGAESRVWGPETGYVNVRVQHTLRSWGSDIESLLQGHVQGLFSNRDPKIDFIQRHSMAFGFSSFLITSYHFDFFGLDWDQNLVQVQRARNCLYSESKELASG